MAAGSLAKPGTEYGPCIEPCEHKDCASTRDLAERPCSVCGEEIGYDQRWYQDGTWTVLTHMICDLNQRAAEAPPGFRPTSV